MKLYCISYALSNDLKFLIVSPHRMARQKNYSKAQPRMPSNSALYRYDATAPLNGKPAWSFWWRSPDDHKTWDKDTRRQPHSEEFINWFFEGFNFNVSM